MATITQTIGGKARLFPSTDAQTVIASTVRRIGGKIEVQWDGITWTDESDYLLTAKGNIKMEGDYGEGIASTADFELDNTTERFLPENIDSPLYEYLLPRVNIRYSVKIETYYFKLFTGYIKTIEPDRKSGVVNFSCFDKTELVLNKPAPKEAAYINQRASGLIQILAEAAGIDSTQYDIEQSNHIIKAAFFGDRYIWPLMGEIAVSERGRVFFDYNGILKFWAREHIQKQQTPIFTLTRDNWLKNLNFSVEEEAIKNKITVKARPRISAGIKVVWTNGDVEILNQYSDTLVWIPAHDQQQAYIDITDDYGELPCTNFIQPIPYTDYIANSASDGSGTDLTGYVKVTTFIDYASSVFIIVNNYSDQDVYLTTFQLRANPLPIWKWIKIIQRDEVSISRYGEQEIKLENDFIDSENFALEIAQVELDRWKNAKNSFKGDILGIPHLQCGDIVSVEIRGITEKVNYFLNEDGSYILNEDGSKIIIYSLTVSAFENYMINGIDWEVDELGFTQQLEFVNPIIIPIRQTISAYARLKGITIQSVTALAYIQPTKRISAKGNIKANINKGMNARGKIIKT